MSMWPRFGATGQSLHNQLSYLAEEAQSLAGATYSDGEVLDAYLRLAAEAETLLLPVLPERDVSLLVLTPRYWATLANPTPIPAVAASVRGELRRLAERLDSARTAVDSQLKIWGPYAFMATEVGYLVPDTNVFLEHDFAFDEVDWHSLADQRPMADLLVAVPLLVIEELDAAKSDRVRSRARYTLKRLFELLGGNMAWSATLRPPEQGHGQVQLRILPEPIGHLRQPIADQEIVDRAAALQSFAGLPVHFLSFDTSCVLRARTSGLNGVRLSHPD